MPGWTTWAILGAVSSLIWLLLSVIETESLSKITLLNVIFIIVFSSLCIDLCFAITKIASFFYPRGLRDTNRFTTLSSAYMGFWIILFVRSSIILYLLSYLPSTAGIGSMLYISSYFFVIITLLITAVFVLLSLSEIPMPERINPKAIYKYLLHLIISLWLASGFFSVINFAIILYEKPILSVPELKVGLICALLPLLVILYLISIPQTYLLKVLEDIHGEVANDKITTSDAKTQIDVILYGLTLSAVLQGHISSVLEAHNRLRELMIEYRLALEKFNEHMLDKTNISDRTFKILKEKPKEMRLAFEKAEAVRRILERKKALIKYMDKDKEDEINNHLKEINESNNKLYHESLKAEELQYEIVKRAGKSLAGA